MYLVEYERTMSTAIVLCVQYVGQTLPDRSKSKSPYVRDFFQNRVKMRQFLKMYINFLENTIKE